MGSSHWAAPFFFVPPPLELENSVDQRVDAAYESCAFPSSGFWPLLLLIVRHQTDC